MTACVNCTRALQPEWKYCISCGTRTSVAAAAPRSRPIPKRTPVPEYAAAATASIPTVSPRATNPASAILLEDAPPAERPENVEQPENAEHPDNAEPAPVNRLAIVALVIAVLASPLAALVGHLALNQLRLSGQRGVLPAWTAIVLGYLWLGFWIVFGISYLATNG